MSSNEVEEAMRRIQSHKGVEGVLVLNKDGVPIRTDLDEQKTEDYAALLHQLAKKTKSVVRSLDETDDLTFFRIRSKKCEIMICPDSEFLLVVIQRNNS